MSMQCAEVKSKLYSAGGPRHEVLADLGGPSLTRQEFLDECDVNGIMDRFEKSGVWPYPEVDLAPRYFDATNVPDLQTALAVMIDAEEAFMSLPAKVRKEFDNSALKFVEFAGDPANLDQMREWGLAPPAKEPEAPMRVEVVGGSLTPEKASGEPPAKS